MLNFNQIRYNMIRNNARAEEGDVLIVMIGEDNELHISKLEEDANE
jgi:SOS-response transcriptional repressor LexA